MNIIYCYDAYCGWCYGFSPVIKKIAAAYQHQFNFEVLSGGMILNDPPQHISNIAQYIQEAYKTVEDYTGILFGEDYLQHIFHPEESDWVLHSEKPAIALTIMKEYSPENVINLASDIQYALHFEGRDLTDDQAYLSILEKYHFDTTDFQQKLNSNIYKEKAHYEFQLVKQLNVRSFPQVLLQVNESKFYLLAKGFTPYEILNQTIQRVLNEIKL
ncbi:MAG TPA: DsbA family protein [Chitinophagaceae bacterium]|nr:MAG: thioredoxin [Bacteroidetes bacterium OLB11]HMN33521.1 DsbA family protein [Chitinophagaceae bacterium]